MSDTPIGAYHLDTAIQMLDSWRPLNSHETRLNMSMQQVTEQLDNYFPDLNHDQCFMIAVWLQLMTWRLVDTGVIESKP